MNPDPSGSANAVFWLGVAVMLAHELDTVSAREWRLLYVLRHMPEARARDTFVLAHIPLVASLLWLCTHPMLDVRIGSQIAFDLFLIVHAGLHRRLAGHALYAFHSRLSRALITSAAVVGAVHLVMLAVMMAHA